MMHKKLFFNIKLLKMIIKKKKERRVLFVIVIEIRTMKKKIE